MHPKTNVPSRKTPGRRVGGAEGAAEPGMSQLRYLSDPERRARLIPGSLEGVPTFALLLWSFLLETVGLFLDISESQAIFVKELRVKRLLSFLTPRIFIGYHIIRKF
jgi:hypothetical protein